MAESLPTSVSAFNHVRHRADSTASFSFYREEEEHDQDEPLTLRRRRSGVDDLDEMPFEDETDDELDLEELERQASADDYVLHRTVSAQSRSSRTRLLRRDSTLSAGSGYGANRSSQKLHMVNEDLYIAIAGFKTSTIGQALYISICIATFGVGWLVFRWMPRWHVKLVGKPCHLRDCRWVVLEVNACATVLPRHELGANMDASESME